MKTKIAFLYTVMCLIWGTTWLAIKIGLQDLPPILFAGFRFVIATIVLGIILKYRGYSLRLKKDEIGPVLFLGLFAIALPFGLVTWGEQYTNSAMGAIIMCALPIAIFPISFLMKSHERLTWLKFAGVMVGFAGVSVIFYPALNTGGSSLKGTIALIMAMLVCSVATVYLKKRGPGMPVMKFLFYQMLFGAPALLVFGFIKESPLQFFQGFLQLKAQLALLYLAIFGSIIALSSYYWLLKKIGAVASTISIFMEVVIAVFLDWLVLSAIPHPYTWLGIVFIFIGVWLVIVGWPSRNRFRRKILVENAPA